MPNWIDKQAHLLAYAGQEIVVDKLSGDLELSVSDLMGIFRCSRPTASRLVDKLSDNGRNEAGSFFWMKYVGTGRNVRKVLVIRTQVMLGGFDAMRMGFAVSRSRLACERYAWRGVYHAGIVEGWRVLREGVFHVSYE